MVVLRILGYTRTEGDIPWSSGAYSHWQKARDHKGRMTNMTNMVYQAQAGDGFKKKGLKRTNSYFNTPQEAIAEALALKEKMDSIYKNEIEWDYNREITGSTEKMKILRGYLGGDKKSKAFYIQILSVKQKEEFNVVTPIKPKNVSSKDKKVMTNVIKLFK